MQKILAFLNEATHIRYNHRGLQSNLNFNRRQIDCYQIKIFYLLLFTSGLRIIFDCCFNLGNDEVYYFTYALQPDWNHFDHPPLVGIFIRLFTLNLAFVNAFTLRLTSIVGSILGTILTARCTRLIGGNRRAAFIAAVLYNCVIFTSIISGMFILPDSPQVIFWMLACCMVVRLVRFPCRKPLCFILFGALVGIAIMCKIHGIFLWLGLLLFAISKKRKLLSMPYLYIGLILTLIIISPIFTWNWENNFITWRFHSARICPQGTEINFSGFSSALLGQILYNNPFDVVILVAAVAYFFRKKQNDGTSVLLFIGLPIILTTSLVSLTRDVLPHWSGPGFMSLIPLGALYTEKYIDYKKWIRIMYKGGIIFILALYVLFCGLTDFYPGTIGKKSVQSYGAGDVSLDMYGWNQFYQEFKEIRQNDIHDGTMNAKDPIVVNKWFPAGHLLFYIAYPLHMRIVGAGELDDLHKFAWLNRKYGIIHKGENAYFIAPSNYNEDPDIIYRSEFKKYEKSIWTEKRGGMIVRYWNIYKLIDAQKDIGYRI